ncbi:Trm112 family protein [Micromonospora sp. RP3T]|uniref:Trm112 family protein n=1 Tax=Micromonospora sp. RP3T TaxID=2135446 RepID=UPI0021053288|nr:Trm112 family protein [Micromonospora sp. RP3T]
MYATLGGIVNVDQELLEILCCPADRGGLSYSAESEDLRCDRCGLCFPVRDGIPALLLK